LNDRVNRFAQALLKLGLKKGETMEEEEVIEYCKHHLASYKKPKSVEFWEDLPRNPSGKVLKTLLREKYFNPKGEEP
jgi:acyl-CoA synthetase (AMP-forming)/AMP-acid ligase II